MHNLTVATALGLVSLLWLLALVAGETARQLSSSTSPLNQNQVQAASDPDSEGFEEREEEKRGWRDLQGGGWGKRAWENLKSGGWGKRSGSGGCSDSEQQSQWKRGWSDLQQAGWGKRGWSDLQGSGWGKRGWSNLHPGWGKRGWQNLHSSGWGKRAWQNLQGSWGKRDSPLDSQAQDDERLDEDKRSWNSLHSTWGKRSTSDWRSFGGYDDVANEYSLED
ncbi:uncharacterized protein Mip isoform X2 [Bemisia tabaci]|uniref:uncharacterized protein Mip isoform X2 n=1 Tax=Bemisia tabaci TaxID=7038 RepID=UPI0008F9D4BE|nr:PREDICTED: prothoracicostatic peptide-like isoform X2 [Bemisia tabaci]